MNKAVATLLAGSLGLLTTAAQAQEDARIPSRGTFVISADRIFGVNAYRGTADRTDPAGNHYETKQSGTQFSLLWGGNGTGGEVENSPNAIPRVSVDYFVSALVSLGGSLGYYAASGERATKNPGQTSSTHDLPDITAVVFAPRVGFMIPISKHVGFWSRAGLTYWTSQTKRDNDKLAQAAYQLNVEGMFWISPSARLGFLVGPVIDLGFGGSQQATTNGQRGPDASLTWTNVGVVAGVGGFF